MDCSLPGLYRFLWYDLRGEGGEPLSIYFVYGIQFSGEGDGAAGKSTEPERLEWDTDEFRNATDPWQLARGVSEDGLFRWMRFRRCRRRPYR